VRHREKPACELCGNEVARARALCAKCDRAIERDAQAPRRPPNVSAKPAVVALEERAFHQRIYVSGREEAPVECSGCGQQNVFDVRLHKCAAGLPRRTA
jgi:hypothetical protein